MTALWEMLQEREQDHLDMLEALPVAIYTTDAGGKITYDNQAAACLCCTQLARYRPRISATCGLCR